MCFILYFSDFPRVVHSVLAPFPILVCPSSCAMHRTTEMLLLLSHVLCEIQFFFNHYSMHSETHCVRLKCSNLTKQFSSIILFSWFNIFCTRGTFSTMVIVFGEFYTHLCLQVETYLLSPLGFYFLH